MSKTRKYGFLGVLVLVVLLGLLLAAGPALAESRAATHVRASFVDMLDEGTAFENQPLPGEVEAFGWTPYAIVTASTGPNAERFYGWATFYLHLIVRPSGDNSHDGLIVFTSVEPSKANWTHGAPFSDNLPAEEYWLWSGTMTGVSLSGHNHVFHMELTGHNDNVGLHATCTWFMNLWTNCQMVAFITPETP